MAASVPDPDVALAARLRERGGRVTRQRLELHRALRELGRHASAEEVRRAAADRLPGLSLPTVYATLDLLDELGLARRLHAGGGVALYDPRPDPHSHLVCRRCGRVEDLEAAFDPAGALAAARAAGARPERAEVVVAGLCAACAAVERP